jgi:hypothetical protein
MSDLIRKLRDDRYGDVHWLRAQAADRIEELEAELLAAQRGYLPVITAEVAHEYSGEKFTEVENGKVAWTQAAVDFVCLTSQPLSRQRR